MMKCIHFSVNIMSLQVMLANTDSWKEKVTDLWTKFINVPFENQERQKKEKQKNRRKP